MKTTYFIIGLILAALLIVPASATFLSGWYDLQTVQVNGTADGAVSNYQIAFTVNNSTGTSSGSTFYANGLLKSDWSDLRFTDSSNNLLNYWIENTSVSSGTGRVWVRISSISSGNTSQYLVYIYYNNSAATAVSNGTTTFTAFDHFDTLDTTTVWNLWRNTGTGGSASATNSILTVAHTGTSGTASLGYRTKYTPSNKFRFMSYEYVSADQVDDWDAPALDDRSATGSYTGSGVDFASAQGASAGKYWYSGHDGTGGTASRSTALTTSYRLIDIAVNGSATQFTVNPFPTPTERVVKTTNPPTDAVGPEYQASSYGAGARSIYVDWMFVANWTTTEPAPTTWTAQQANATAPTASFSTNKTSGAIPCTIQFTDSSTGTPTSWLWQWGDGTANSTTQSPIHTFTTIGTYQVNLTATNAGGSSLSGNTAITAWDYPSAGFTRNVSSGYPKYDVQFNDTSTGGPDTWAWQFGDGGTSTLQNPVHSYQSWIGNSTVYYDVKLNASNSHGNSWYNMTSAEAAMPLTAIGGANVSGGIVPFTVAFTGSALTGSPTTWDWNFNDGTAHGNTQNTTHTYTTAGVRPVVLNASNAYSYSWSNLGSMTAWDPVVVDFVGTPIPSTSSVTFNVTVTSGDPTNWYWQFGDTQVSTLKNVTHAYPSGDGTYTVTFTASNIASGSSDIVTKTNYIQILGPLTANFTANKTTSSYPADIQFTNTSIGTPTNYYWTFGDGGTSTSQNPIHTYTASGYYNVSLTINNSLYSNTTTI